MTLDNLSVNFEGMFDLEAFFKAWGESSRVKFSFV